MESINRIFFRGLITLLPIAITIYILYSAIIILENLLGSLLRRLLFDYFYIPGLGFILTIILIFLFGLMLNNFVLIRILESFEKRLIQVPFIKAIYSPLKDLMNLFSKQDKDQFKKIVMIKIGNPPYYALGIVTRDHFSDLDLGNNALTENKVAVFIPYSYAIGGFTLLINKEDIIPVDIPIEKAMSLAITAWVKMDSKVNTKKV